MNYFTGVVKNYTGFQGRARRAEYWQYTLVYFIIYAVLFAVGAAIHFALLASIFALALLLPSLAVGVRRLHDTDKSGWWLLIVLVPLVGAIVLLVFTCLDGTPGPNKYGPSPKGLGGAEAGQQPYNYA
ncbi:MAG TPA: DUF805 domain-containing protein [Actinospica sp.]|nr:DUF805 domain-containing protein [Actinospica sp.]